MSADFYLFYWCSEDGGNCSYDVDKARAIYTYSENEDAAWNTGFEMLRIFKLSDEAPEDCFWTVRELEEDDFSEIADWENKRLVLTNPNVRGMNGCGETVYQIVSTEG